MPRRVMQMDVQEYSYEAFISYRHNPRDSFIAKRLSKVSEGYRVPTSKLQEELRKKKVGKLFRDEDELPFGGVLNDAISAAIRGSKKFIMLLSPDYLDENHWCLYELAEFLKNRHYRDVIVVMSSGGIAELTKQTCEAMRKMGLNFYDETDETGKPVDPFAIDLTQFESENELGKEIKDKRLKVLAGILDVDYDDLNRREHRRQIRKRWAVLTPVLTFISAFAITVTLLAININNQKNIAEEQRNIAQEQRNIAQDQRNIAQEQRNIAEEQRNIAQMNEMGLLIEGSKNASANGDRLAGMRYALDSLDIYNSLFPEGSPGQLEPIRQALEGSVYCGNLQLLAPVQSNNRKFGDMMFSPDDRYILGMLGHYNEAALIDAGTGVVLYSLNRVRPYGDYALTSYSFSPSGEYFMTGFGVYTCEIVVWHTGGKPDEAASLSVDENNIEGKFLSEHEIIFSASPGYFEDNEVSIWNFTTNERRLPTEEEIRNYREEAREKEQNTAYSGQLSVQFSPDGRIRYETWGVESGTGVKCFDAGTNIQIGEIPEAEVVLAFSHDNMRILAGSGSGFLGLFSAPQNSDITSLSEFLGELYDCPTNVKPDLSDIPELMSNHYVNTDVYPFPSITWRKDPSGRFIAFVHPDYYVEVWDMEKDDVYPAYGLHEHIGGVTGILLTEKHLVTTGWDGRLIIVDLFSGALEMCISVPEGIATLNIDPSGDRAIVLTTQLKTAYVYDISSGLQLMRLDAEAEDTFAYSGPGINTAAFSADGSIAVAEESSGRVVVGKIMNSIEELSARARLLTQ